MIKVGWRLTRVCRRDANSEYRRLTSRSFPVLASFDSLEDDLSYPRTDSVCDVTPSALFASMNDLYIEIWVFIEDLLNPTIIASLLRLHCARC